MARIVLKNVHVRYPVTQDHYRSLRRVLVRLVTLGRMYNDDVRSHTVHALRDLSLTLEKGDRIGLIGRNGAGKSTLLKTLGGFILPSEGEIEVEGNIMPLFSVAAGMDEERSGYDNIYLSGRLLGIPRKEMEKHVKDIEDFCELGEFLKMPVRTYSDGMRSASGSRSIPAPRRISCCWMRRSGRGMRISSKRQAGVRKRSMIVRAS